MYRLYLLSYLTEAIYLFALVETGSPSKYAESLYHKRSAAGNCSGTNTTITSIIRGTIFTTACLPRTTRPGERQHQHQSTWTRFFLIFLLRKHLINRNLEFITTIHLLLICDLSLGSYLSRTSFVLQKPHGPPYAVFTGFPPGFLLSNFSFPLFLLLSRTRSKSF